MILFVNLPQNYCDEAGKVYQAPTHHVFSTITILYVKSVHESTIYGLICQKTWKTA